MTRPLKPYKVDRVSHPNKTTGVDVFFDRDKKVFFVAVDLARVEDSDLEKAKALGRELLVRGTAYEWEPVIVVDGVDEESAHYGHREPGEKTFELRFEFYRCERTKNPAFVPADRAKGRYYDVGSRYLQRTHELDFLASEPSKEAVLNRESNGGRDITNHQTSDDDVVMPYSQEAWDALERLRDALVETRRRLALFVARPALARRLVEAPAPLPMLPAPPPRGKKLPA